MAMRIVFTFFFFVQSATLPYAAHADDSASVQNAVKPYQCLSQYYDKTNGISPADRVYAKDMIESDFKTDPASVTDAICDVLAQDLPSVKAATEAGKPPCKDGTCVGVVPSTTAEVDRSGIPELNSAISGGNDPNGPPIVDPPVASDPLPAKPVVCPTPIVTPAPSPSNIGKQTPWLLLGGIALAAAAAIYFTNQNKKKHECTYLPSPGSFYGPKLYPVPGYNRYPCGGYPGCSGGFGSGMGGGLLGGTGTGVGGGATFPGGVGSGSGYPSWWSGGTSGGVGGVGGIGGIGGIGGFGGVGGIGGTGTTVYPGTGGAQPILPYIYN